MAIVIGIWITMKTASMISIRGSRLCRLATFLGGGPRLVLRRAGRDECVIGFREHESHAGI